MADFTLEQATADLRDQRMALTEITNRLLELQTALMKTEATLRQIARDSK